MVSSLEEVADQSSPTLGDIIAAIGTRSLGPMLLVPAVLALSPLGAIPGMPTLLACVILLIAGYWFLSGDSLWLPSFLRDRSISAQTLQKSIDKIKPAAEWTDKSFGNQFASLVRPATENAVAVAVGFIAVLMPPLELLPLAVAVPAGCIMLLALGLTIRNGVLLACGFALTLVVPAIAFWAAL